MSERYVALLRGINVGGNSLVSMSTLRNLFSEHGYSNVNTYINSGNVLFTSTTSDAAALEATIEALLAKSLPFAPRVVVRSESAIASTVAHIPAGWNSPTPQKCNVIFLKREIDSPDILQKLSAKPGIETIAYHPGVLYWSALTSALTKSNMIKLSRDPLYQQMTVRNLNTVRKLNALMSVVE